jgi:hypothetical protein
MVSLSGLDAFHPSGMVTRTDSARDFAASLASAAGLGERLELREDRVPDALSIGGPDGFGFFGTTAFRWVRVPLPCTYRALAVAVARHALGEYWATDDEIAGEWRKLPLAFAFALGPGQ